MSTNYIHVMRVFEKIIFCFLVLPITTTHAFTDILPSDPQKAVFEHLRDVHIMGSLQDGGFHPEKILSRAEALTVALRAGSISIPADFALEKIPFTDVDPNSWYAPTVARALELKMISAHSPSFRPNQAVTKSEFLAMIFRTTLVDLRPYHKNLKSIALDIQEEHWFAPYFAYAKKYQIAYLPSDQLYRPHKYLSRREGAMMAFRQLKIFHGGEETKYFVELQAQIQQFISLLRGGHPDKAEFHLQRITELQRSLTQTKNNKEAVAAQALSLAMQHFSESLKYFQYQKNLAALENLHLAAKQLARVQEKSESLGPFARELSGLIDETLLSFINPNHRFTSK